jgi:diguanylate cyclase (GGDEF)-like protein
MSNASDRINTLDSAHWQVPKWDICMNQSCEDIMQLTALCHALQSCQSRDEMYQIAAHWASKLFPDVSGTLSILDPVTATLHTAASWGNPTMYSPCQHTMCSFLHTSRGIAGHGVARPQICSAMSSDGERVGLCVPLQTQGHLYGALWMYLVARDSQEWRYQMCLAEAFAAHLTCTLSHLSSHKQLADQAFRDSLTDLYHRGYLEEALQRTYQQAVYMKQSFGLMMLDIDHFKHINDTYGHQAGDVVLRILGACIRVHLCHGDIACRYGGDEFTILLPGASLEDTRQRATILHQCVRQLHPIYYQEHELEPLTISLGVATFPEYGDSGAEVMRAADQALYQAKAAGRNQVRVAE